MKTECDKCDYVELDNRAAGPKVLKVRVDVKDARKNRDKQDKKIGHFYQKKEKKITPIVRCCCFFPADSFLFNLITDIFHF